MIYKCSIFISKGFEDLHLFDASIDLKTRFDRSASYTANAVESPLPAGLNDDSNLDITFSEKDEYDYFYEKTANMSNDEYNFGAMKEKYENGKKYEIKDKYLTLLEEINAESADDIYLDDDLYDEVMVPSNKSSKDLFQAEISGGVPRSMSGQTDYSAKQSYKIDSNSIGIAIYQTGSFDSANDKISASCSPSLKQRNFNIQEAKTPYNKVSINKCSFTNSPSGSNGSIESPDRYDQLNISNASIEELETEILHKIRSSYPFSNIINDEVALSNINIDHLEGSYASSPPTISSSIPISQSLITTDDVEWDNEIAIVPNSNTIEIIDPMTTVCLEEVMEQLESSFPFSTSSPVINQSIISNSRDINDLICSEMYVTEIVGTPAESSFNSQTISPLSNGKSPLLKELNNPNDYQPGSSNSNTSSLKRFPLQHINQSDHKVSNKSNLKVGFAESNSNEVDENFNNNIKDNSSENGKYETPTTVYSKDVFGSFMKSIDSTSSVYSRGSYKVLTNSKKFNRSVEYTPPPLELCGEFIDTPIVNDSTTIDSTLIDQLMGFLRSGDITSCTKIVEDDEGNIIISDFDANNILLKFAENIDMFKNPIETVEFLINYLKVNVNAVDSKGKSALHYLISYPEIGKILLNKGSDILLDDYMGLCPLSLSFSDKSEWLLLEFEQCGREIDFLTNGNSHELFKYATYLILAGHSKKAISSIKAGNIQITPLDATVLLKSCSGNFENMKEPVETFELLEALGASLDD